MLLRFPRAWDRRRHAWLMVALAFLFMLVNFADKAVVVAALGGLAALLIDPQADLRRFRRT